MGGADTVAIRYTLQLGQWAWHILCQFVVATHFYISQAKKSDVAEEETLLALTAATATVGAVSASKRNKKRSTTTNLLETMQDWTLAIHSKRSVFAIYIDFAKAFDTVRHNKLIHKLSCYGISGNLLQWIKSFLCCRTQQTRVGNCLSCILEICSGIVQGSVIGPLLFVLFINDIIEIFSDGKLFADDVKM